MEFLTKLLGIATAVAETTTTTGAADPAAVTTDSAAGGIVGILFSLLPLLLVFVLMYFMMIRPEKKRRKKEQDMLASLKKGDRVCTIGGIYATIESIKDDTITLSVGKGDQTMVVARWAIRSVEDVTIENETESLNYSQHSRLRAGFFCARFSRRAYAGSEQLTRWEESP